MTVQGLLYCFIDLTVREIATLEECHPPSSPTSSCQMYFLRLGKAIHLNTASDSITRGKCLLNHEFWHWRSSMGKTLQLYLWHSKVSLISVSVHAIFNSQKQKENVFLCLPSVMRWMREDIRLVFVFYVRLRGYEISPQFNTVTVVT